MNIEVQGIVYEIIAKETKTFQFMISIQDEKGCTPYQLHCTVPKRNIHEASSVNIGSKVKVKGTIDGSSYTSTQGLRRGTNTFWIEGIELL